jgi:hypothetical protein
VIALALLSIGCKARELAWGYQIDPSIDEATVAILAHVRAPAEIDGLACPMGEELETDLRIATYRFARMDGAPVDVLALEPGAWALEVEALDAECGAIGRGCVDLELPLEDGAAVLVPVIPATRAPTSCSGVCTNGICEIAD